MADKKKSTYNNSTIAVNRKARFNYTIVDTYEAGIVLTGTEVKSLRTGTVNLGDAHIQSGSNEFSLEVVNLHIPEYTKAGPQQQHKPLRPRRLLMRKKEIKKIMLSLKKDGFTAICLKLYFSDRGLVKLQIGLARGKNVVDKRKTIKEREWNISKQRLLKNFNN